MITNQELLDTILNELRILKFLYGKMPTNILDYRPTSKQRSTLELLRYLSHFAGIEIVGIKAGRIEDFERQTKAYSQMPAEDFIKEMEKQETLLKEVYPTITNEEMEEEIDLFGRGAKKKRKLLLLDLVLKSLVAYKMQLFLYLKSNSAEIGTPELWRGEDSKKA